MTVHSNIQQLKITASISFAREPVIWETCQVSLLSAPGSFSGGSSTEPGGAISKTAHSHAWQAGAGRRLGTPGGQLARGLIPFAGGFFMGCLDPKSCSHPTDGKVETVRVSRLKFRSWHSGGLLVK